MASDTAEGASETGHDVPEQPDMRTEQLGATFYQSMRTVEGLEPGAIIRDVNGVVWRWNGMADSVSKPMFRRPRWSSFDASEMITQDPPGPWTVLISSAFAHIPDGL